MKRILAKLLNLMCPSLCVETVRLGTSYLNTNTKSQPTGMSESD